MIARLFLTAAILLAIMIFLRHLDRIRAALKRFDDSNRQRQEDEARDKSDDLAHFRHTLKAAEERVEKIHEIIERDGSMQFLFHGKVYGTRREAENARAEAVRAVARAFYMDLPIALSERRDDGKLN